MKRIVELSNYQLRVYFKSSRFVMPFIVTVVFLAVLYSSRPVSIESSFALTCFLLFGVMAWAGYTFPSGEDTVMEQILFLRVKSGLIYYAGKSVALAAAAVLLSGFGILIPGVQWLLHGGMFFDRAAEVSDLLAALLLFPACSFAGGALGGLLHPVVIPERKCASLLTTLFVLLSVIRGPLVREIPFLRALFWVLPPVEGAASVYMGTQDALPARLTGYFAALFLYGVVYCVVKSLICFYKKI